MLLTLDKYMLISVVTPRSLLVLTSSTTYYNNLFLSIAALRKNRPVLVQVQQASEFLVDCD